MASSVISTAGAYQIGDVVLDLPTGVVAHVSALEGRWLLRFGASATETSSFELAKNTVASMSFTPDGDFIKMFWDGNTYLSIYGQPATVIEPYKPPAGTRGMGAPGSAPPSTRDVRPTLDSGRGPTLAQLRLIARSLRAVEAPADSTSGGQVSAAQVPNEPTIETNIRTAFVEAPFVRNFMVGTSVPVCSKWTISTKRAIEIWETGGPNGLSAGSQTPDQTANPFFVFEEKEANDAHSYTDCENAVSGGPAELEAIEVFAASSAGMQANDCAVEDREANTVTIAYGCAQMAADALRPYYSVTDAFVLVHDEDGTYADTRMEDSLLTQIITHELGHYVTGPLHNPVVCNAAAPVVAMMAPFAGD